MRDEASVWWTYLFTRVTSPYRTRRLLRPRETAFGYDIPVPVNIEIAWEIAFGHREPTPTDQRSYLGVWLDKEAYLWIVYAFGGKTEKGKVKVDIIGHLILGKGEETEVVLSLVGVNRRLWRLISQAKDTLEKEKDRAAGVETIETRLIIGPPDPQWYPIDNKRWALPEFVIDQLYGGVEKLRAALDETETCLDLGLEPRFQYVYLALVHRWGPFDEQTRDAICELSSQYQNVPKEDLPAYCVRLLHPTYIGLDGLPKLFEDSADLDPWGLDALGVLFNDDKEL